MKLLRCHLRQDGRQELTVRDAGPVLMRLTTRPGGPPIKAPEPWRVVGDDEARRVVRELLDLKLYEVSK